MKQIHTKKKKMYKTNIPYIIFLTIQPYLCPYITLPNCKKN